jgi:hypothetical protein
VSVFSGELHPQLVARLNAKSSFLRERIPIRTGKMHVDTKWLSDPLLKLVSAPTPELIMLPRNRAAAAAWSLQTVYDLAAKSRDGLRFNCKNLASKCASLRFTCNRQKRPRRPMWPSPGLARKNHPLGEAIRQPPGSRRTDSPGTWGESA